jgi:hypothetical protein
VETSSSDQDRKADEFASTEATEHASPGGSPAWVARVHFLFLGGAAIRGGLALVLVLCSMYILNLLDTSDLVGWLVLGLTTAGVAWVLLDHAYDIEGALARQAALAAVFDPDAYGARAEAVRSYSDECVRTYGRVPHGLTHLRQPDDNRAFRVYFPSRRVECRRWCAEALLMSAQRALRVVAVGLIAVIACQLYVFLAA